MKVAGITLMVLGAVVLLAGSLGLTVSLANPKDFDGEREQVYAMTGFITGFGLLLAVSGYILLWRVRRAFRINQVTMRERATIQAAALHQGVLTVASLMSETQMSVEQAQQALNSLVEQGVGFTRTRPDCGTEYWFPGLETTEVP